jgi:predicted PurR-regulated permease PerM
VVIEYTNAQTHPHRSSAATFVVICATIFLFIPTTIIVLGYYVSQPVGNLISPLPEGVISENLTPEPSMAQVNPDEQLIIAANKESTPSSVSQNTSGNSSDHAVTLLANTPEIAIKDVSVTDISQILIIPKESDKSVYFVKSKSNGSFILATGTDSNMDRVIDYQIVSP